VKNQFNLNRDNSWRMADWLLIAVMLALLVWAMAPQQLPVSIYKLSLVTMAAVLGYGIDRSLFPYARPGDLMADDAPDDDEPDAVPPRIDGMTVLEVVHEAHPHLLAAAMIRRALIVAATMLAVGLGA
jgi:hypothetical protein